MGRPLNQVEVCNLALDHLREAPISSLDSPETKTEILCARWADHIRRVVLRKHSWNFATKRAQLPMLVDAPLFDYAAAFQLPNDFVRLASVGERGEIYDYQLEDSKILTYDTTTPLPVRYIYDFKEIPKMDSLFIQMWALELGIALGYPITGSREAERALEQKLSLEAPQGYAVDGQERPPTRIERSRYKSRRLQGTGGGTSGSRFDGW